MPRSLLFALIVLVAAPLVLLGWVTLSAMQERERQASEQVEGLIRERLGEFDESISDMLQTHARRLQKEISGRKNSIDALKEVQLSNPIVRQGIFVSRRGLMLYPPKPTASDSDALALHSSLLALVDSRPLAPAGDAGDLVGQVQQRSMIPVAKSPGSKSKIPTRRQELDQQQEAGNTSGLQNDLQIPSQLPNIGPKSVLVTNSGDTNPSSISVGNGYSWQTWYMDEGAQLTFWMRGNDGSSVGVLLERSRWMSDVIASLPGSSPQPSLSTGQRSSPLGYTALVDETQRVLYQWGDGFGLEKEIEPRVAQPVSAPLASWQLKYYSSAELVSPRSVAPVVLSLAGIGVLLLSLGAYVMTSVQRQMTAARKRVSFAGQVSHELRTPLTNIRLYTELAESDLEKLPEDSIRQSLGTRLGIIDRESRRLQRLVSGVLEMIRDGGKRVGVRRTMMNPNDVILQSLEQFSPCFDSAGISTRLDLQTDREVSLDADVVEMILVNLLSNVEKYVGLDTSRSADSTKGICEIRSRFENDALVVTVSDNGPGIDAADRRRVFQPFSRLDDSINAPSGTGIGLTIARRAARRHGGELVLLAGGESSGARFQFHLPLTDADLMDTGSEHSA